jgi:SAM-dependent methyltransferase
MDLTDPAQRRIFFEVHRELPREAPGSDASTGRALACIGATERVERVLDLACGPGMQTLALARGLPAAEIVALDLHAPFLAEVRRRARAANCADRVHPVCADLAAAPFRPATFDLLWCEGGAYLLGVAEALASWQPLLRPGGWIAFTEAVFLRDDLPSPVRSFWADYPGMQSVDGVRATARDAGLRLLCDFVLPASDWWDAYYAPMERRIAALRRQHAGDAAAGPVLDACQAEIDLYRTYPDCYGYAFFVAAA